ncbi:uncharacterized protein [Onthophagus taurus]|uniref:uncharacterized protein isoform X1 n=1 Tax=Onthophagus taurus TaxID=166361 RepID=UPI0039BE8E70
MTLPEGLYYVLSTVYFKMGRLAITCNVQKGQPIPEECDCNQFRLEFLKAHNEYRNNHGVPPLTLSDEICDYAQEWAEALAIGDALLYRKRPRYGESIMSVYSNDPHFKISGDFPVSIWYDQKNDFTFGAEPEDSKSDHFCQMVWKNTKNIGIGLARSESGSYYVVANYHPTGIRAGQYVENVLPDAGDTKPPSFIDESKKKMQEVQEVIDKMEQGDPSALPDLTKELQGKAQDVVDTLSKIKEESEHIKNVPDLQNVKDKIDEIASTWQNIAEINPEKQTGETNAALDEIIGAISEFGEKREQAIQMADVTDDASAKADALMQTIGDMNADAERVPELFEELKGKMLELIQAIDNIDEKRTFGIQIPGVADKIITNIDVLTNAAEQLKTDEEFVQEQADIVGEVDQKTQEVVEAAEEIKAFHL